MSQPLEGVVVLDATSAFWASLGTALLADFGATVVRLDEPGASAHLPEHENDLANRNKLSIAIDRRNTDGRQALERLIAKADAFVTDMDRAALQEQRLDYPTVAALKRDLIYGRGSGYGPKGPDRDLPAFDELAAARTGMMPILPQPGQPPVYTATGQMYSSVMLAFGVMLALWHRDETGEGQEVDASLLGGNMYGASLDIQAFLAIGGERFLHPVARLDAGNPMSGTLYPTQDGLWVTLTMPDTDRWWPGLADITGLDANDARFNSHAQRCEVNRVELIAELERAFRKSPAAHWRSVIAERQLSADVIEEYSYPANDENAQRNQFVIERQGRKSLGFPLYMSETPARTSREAPVVGEHTSLILRDLVGYNDVDLDSMRSEGSIA